MPCYLLYLLLAILISTCMKPAKSQEPADPVAKALADGDAFRKQRDYDRAMSAYCRGDKLSHHTCADCFLGMFRLDREVGNMAAAFAFVSLDGESLSNVEGAIAMYLQAIQAQPNQIKGHRLLADALAQKGDRDDAILEYQQIVKLEPDNAEYHFTLGAQLEGRGAAAGYVRDDFSKRPGSLALPKTAQADYEAALEQYGLAHQLAPQNPAYTEAYERTKSRLKQD